IGYEIAKRLGLEGANVMVSSRKERNVSETVENLKSIGINADGCVCHIGNKVDRTQLITKSLEKFGGIDILVSNAAVNTSMGNIFETDEKSWDKIFEINLKSSFLLCQEVLPHLQKSKGSIVFVSSIGGYVPFELLGPYSISKTALISMVKSMVPECSRRNIRVNAIAPGVIKTKFSAALWNNEDICDSVLSTIPLKRFGTGEDCAGAVAFLASSDASYITGETIVVAGGMQSRL
ncbi:hypothetical protein HELRODRAFT_70909, partial [Helobdella robusta]|uniref:Dehydrogenase/reductase SDR family member 4 n=1 Tax=Helobdella robusta TaxID=6412 RepID=T1G0E2_HELRO